MMKLLRNLKIDNSGGSAAEYALMIALIGGVVVGAATILGTNMSTVFTTFSGKVVTPA